MRPSIPILWLLSCMPIAALAQSARQEKSIKLPAGVSAEVQQLVWPSASVSPRTTLVAAICSDHLVRTWSPRSGELLLSLDAHAGLPTAVQFSSDGRLLAVAYEKGAIKVFDTDSGKIHHELTLSAPMYVLAFSPDNQRLAGAGDFDTYIWDLATHKKLATISPPFGWSSWLSFSPDGRWVATADGDTFVRVYDANSGSLRSIVKDFILEPMAVAFLPDGKSLLAGGVDKTVSIIDPESGKVLRALPKQAEIVVLLDVSADGKKAAAVYRSAERFNDIDQVRLWDVAEGTVLASFHMPGVTITGGAFVDDHYLFTAATANEITAWSLR
jgi:WD40 repeat protein